MLCAVLGGCATLAPPPPAAAYVVLGEDGAAVARVVTAGAACPSIEVDGRALLMTLRAAPKTMALRPTASAPEDSKPSVFPDLICEATLPPGAAHAQVQGLALALPKARIERIVVIGDTGCRIKKADAAFQSCQDSAAYPFATVAAAAAAWKPDLVVHVGDYLYRENACPPGQSGCAGSPWGYGWDAWQADFFTPAQPLLRAAPWVVARGNHESCSRGGQGFWRLLDPRALLPGRDCIDPADDGRGDYGDPYAVPLGADAQLIVIDSSNSISRKPKLEDARSVQRAERFGQTRLAIEALARRAVHNIGVNHHPALAFAAVRRNGNPVELKAGDYGQQTYYGAVSPTLLPERIDAMLSGHVHVWEQVSFASAHPSQFVAGFSGTLEEEVPLPETLPAGASPAPGAIVEHFSSWNAGFGFMTMERCGAAHWDVKVWDLHGKLQRTCQLEGRKSSCAAAPQ